MVRIEPLFLAVVADRVPRGVDAAVERRIGDDPAAPYQGDEIVPADDMVAVLQQMHQQVEYLRLHRDQLAITAQLAKIGIEDVIIEAEFHVRYRIFSKETIKSSHEEIKHQAKSCVRFCCILREPGVATPLPGAESYSCRKPKPLARPCRAIEC